MVALRPAPGFKASGVHALVPNTRHLNSAVGSATSPDVAAWTAPASFVLTARATIPHVVGANRFLACQWPTGPSTDQAWLWYVTTTGILHFTLRRSSDGAQVSANILSAAEVNALPSPAYVGVRAQGSAGRFACLTSTNGINWTETGTPVVTTTWTGSLNSVSPLNIGSRSGTNGDPFGRPIHWVEMRSGLDPGAGNRRFLFDPADWSSGTTWTDPRGVPWTLTAAGAIQG